MYYISLEMKLGFGMLRLSHPAIYLKKESIPFSFL